MILRDYLCSQCENVFEAWDDEDALCPKCDSSELSQTWTKPPGIKSIRTSNADAIVSDLINAHGLTDYNGNPSTSHAYTPPKDMNIQSMEAPAKLSLDLQTGKQEVIDKGIGKVLSGIQTPFGTVTGTPQKYNALSEIPRLPNLSSQTLYLGQDGKYRDRSGRVRS